MRAIDKKDVAEWSCEKIEIDVFHLLLVRVQSGDAFRRNQEERVMQISSDPVFPTMALAATRRKPMPTSMINLG
jgi:hypothetical protein